MLWKSSVIVVSLIWILFITIHAQERWNDRRKGDKRGRCPKPGHGLCADLCSYDTDCPRREKCCYNGCGHECVDPYSEVIKPGRCPKIGYGTCSDRCSSDRDCPGREKCCAYRCKHICIAPEIEDVCHLPKEVGNCYSKKKRYYFNVNSKRCRYFYYTGCGGNENNFSSLKSCQQQCERNKYY
ncbi:hypothetical protein ACJMK2_006343 [Sinanodonta woodiana]|uniref:Uncharacterized protein n=1 Tax=Sinanodonta woodiana TaxID=1069815 RepID=A0ABD3VW22_SINWO